MPHANTALVESDVLGLATPPAWSFVRFDPVAAAGPRSVLQCSAGQSAQGILSDITTNAPLGQGADVAVAGTTQLQAGAAWNPGDELTSDANGFGIPLASFATGGTFTLTFDSTGAIATAALATAGSNYPNPSSTVTFAVTGSSGTTTAGKLTVGVKSNGTLDSGNVVVTTAGTGITGTAVVTYTGPAAKVNAVAEEAATAVGAIHHVSILKQV